MSIFGSSHEGFGAAAHFEDSEMHRRSVRDPVRRKPTAPEASAAEPDEDEVTDEPLTNVENPWAEGGPHVGEMPFSGKTAVEATVEYPAEYLQD